MQNEGSNQVLRITLIALGVLVVGFGIALFIFRVYPTLAPPRLEPVGELPEGYDWRFYQTTQQTYGYESLSQGSGVGIEFETREEIDPPEDVPRETGEVASYTVEWTILNDQPNVLYPFVREAKFTIRRGLYPPTRVYVWAYASSEEDLNTILDHLDGLQFERRTEEENGSSI